MYRKLLITWIAVVTTASAGQAQTISAACAERDLQAITFIEQRGEAGDLPSTTLGEFGLMQQGHGWIVLPGRRRRRWRSMTTF